jgi:hypothetical protein
MCAVLDHRPSRQENAVHREVREHVAIAAASDPAVSAVVEFAPAR